MWELLKARFAQGKRTIVFPPPEGASGLAARFRGRPAIDRAKCASGCDACAEACPTGSISFAGEGLRLDLGRCVFCDECREACPEGALRFTQDHRLAASARADLVLAGAPDEPRLARALGDEMRRLFGRSLKLRQVSAGGCNGCESELNAAGNVVFDLSRFGIQFVASPRHADGLVVTGPVTENMRFALLETWAASASSSSRPRGTPTGSSSRGRRAGTCGTRCSRRTPRRHRPRS